MLISIHLYAATNFIAISFYIFILGYLLIFVWFFFRFYMMMRINFKTILLVLIVAVISSIFTSWNNCGSSILIRTAEWKTRRVSLFIFFIPYLFTYILDLFLSDIIQWLINLDRYIFAFNFILSTCIYMGMLFIYIGSPG